MSQNAVTWDADKIRTLLDTSDRAVARAIAALHQRQTADEQRALQTKERNGVGFNSVDAPFLSSIAVRLPHYNGRMTPRQIAKARTMLRKYAGQLARIANQNQAAEPAVQQPNAEGEWA